MPRLNQVERSTVEAQQQLCVPRASRQGVRIRAQGSRRATTAVLGSATAALPVQNLKHDRVGRAGIDSQEDLKGKALAALHRLQKLPHIVQGFFPDQNLRYITA